MTRKETLQKAEKCVNGDRDLKYGKPENSFAEIAKYWTKYLGINIKPADIAVMMCLFKIARLKTSDFEDLDSWVDLVGYAACGAEIATKVERLRSPQRWEE